MARRIVQGPRAGFSDFLKRTGTDKTDQGGLQRYWETATAWKSLAKINGRSNSDCKINCLIADRTDKKRIRG
jgi:hypothetical protein